MKPTLRETCKDRLDNHLLAVFLILPYPISPFFADAFISTLRPTLQKFSKWKQHIAAPVTLDIVTLQYPRVLHRPKFSYVLLELWWLWEVTLIPHCSYAVPNIFDPEKEPRRKTAILIQFLYLLEDIKPIPANWFSRYWGFAVHK